MPWANNPETNSLRMKYNAAFAAHRERSRALVEANMQGIVSPEQISAEARARLELEDAQAKFLAAMTKVITGGASIEPPLQT
jgi:hypothetical protein